MQISPCMIQTYHTSPTHLFMLYALATIDSWANNGSAGCGACRGDQYSDKEYRDRRTLRS